MKIHRAIFFLTAVLFLFSCSRNQPKTEFLTEDIQISENLSSKNLNGHTVSISKNGIELVNLFNGNITILKNTGAGTVTIKNSSIDILTVESKSTVILDSTTTVKKLIIRDNAKVTSTKTLEKKYSKRKDRNPENYITQQPVIETVEIEYGLLPLFEGGKIENIVKLAKPETEEKTVISEITTEQKKTETAVKTDKPAEVVISKQSEAVIQKIETSGAEEKLYLVQDKSYTGDGVKIDIFNRPPDTGYMQIYKTDSRFHTDQIAWYTEYAFWEPEQISRYRKDSFTYEYLNAGEKYDFVVNYYKENKTRNTFTLVESSRISVIPESGSEFTFESTGVSMSVNPESGIAEWNKTPEIRIKPGSVLKYSLQWGNWKYFGHLNRKADAPNAYASVNIYQGMEHIDSTLFKNEAVFINLSYEYDGYTWNIYQSDSFEYDISKAKVTVK